MNAQAANQTEDCSQFASNAPYCDTGGVCSPCLETNNSGCTTLTASKCLSHTCTSCQTNSDCSQFSSTAPFCDESGVCSFCLESDNSGCTLLSASKCLNHECASCQSNLDCSQFSSIAPYCDTGGVCSPCLESNNNGCTNLTASKCLSHACTSCQTNSDCSQFSSTAPFCDESGVCSFCLESDNSGCTLPSSSKCLNHNCISCQSNSDCSQFSSSAPFCDSAGICRSCLETDNSGCTSVIAPKCLNHACTGCQSNSDCLQFSSAALFCDAAGVCRACLDSDSSGCASLSAPKCANHTCTGCKTNGDCSHFNSTAPFCEGAVCSSTQSNQTNGTPAINPPSQAGPISLNRASGYLSDFRALHLTFSQNLNNLPSLDSQFFSVSIQGLNFPQDFTYTWSIQNDNYSILIQFEYGQITLSENILQVIFDPTAFSPTSNSHFYFPTPSNISVVLPRVSPLSPSGAVSSLTRVSGGVQIVAMIAVSAAAVPAIFTTGIFGSLWNFISLCQIVNYLMFMQLVWPENALIIFKIFAAANLQFLPNPFQPWVIGFDSLVGNFKLPFAFSQNGMSGIFIRDSGTSVALWLAIGSLMALSVCLKLCWRSRLRAQTSSKKSPTRCVRLSTLVRAQMSCLFWRTPFRTLSSNVVGVTMCALVQLYFSENSINWVLISSATLAIVSIYLAFIFLVALCCIIYMRPLDQSNQRQHISEYGKKYGCLFEDYKKCSPYTRSFEVISYLRKGSFVFFLVSSQSAIPQVPLICINSFTYLGFLLTLLPYKKKGLLLLNIGSEGIISAIMICSLILLNDQTGANPQWMSHDQITSLGWVIVTMCLLLVLLNALFILNDAVKSYLRWWRKIRFWLRMRRRRSKKRQPHLSQGDSLVAAVPSSQISIQETNTVKDTVKIDAQQPNTVVIKRKHVRPIRLQLLMDLHDLPASS